MGKKFTTEDFLARVKELWGNDKNRVNYDYSQVDYVNMHTKVKIICPIHGSFEQTPINHLHGQGCPKCAGKVMGTEDFIKKARLKHKDKYDYSKVEYKGAFEKVLIKCNNCGHEFLQTPNNHLMGQNCPECARNKKKTTKSFIKEARAVHGRWHYGYEKTNYVNAFTKIIITCRKHGDFLQTPNHHLMGQGCPECKLENLRKS